MPCGLFSPSATVQLVSAYPSPLLSLSAITLPESIKLARNSPVGPHAITLGFPKSFAKIEIEKFFGNARGKSVLFCAAMSDFSIISAISLFGEIIAGRNPTKKL
ncbi:MAG: hypothetical protein ACD_76C00068G0002 [uncultured bacterium]|nr:MAG: hypothetical protein ACD_76C00068G0002 [uncultured bacterium]